MPMKHASTRSKRVFIAGEMRLHAFKTGTQTCINFAAEKQSFSVLSNREESPFFQLPTWKRKLVELSEGRVFGNISFMRKES